MEGTPFSFFNKDNVTLMRDKVFTLLEDQGVILDQHDEMFERLADAGVNVDKATGMVRFPRPVMERFIDQTPKRFLLGARNTKKALPLPRPDGTFYARTNTGAHGWIEPETNDYRKVTTTDLANWGHLANELDEINFIPYLFCHDVPVQTADIHALSTLLKHTDKHIWVQPYSEASVEYLIKLGAVIAGGVENLKDNPVISMIACSLTPRTFKHMDIEIIFQTSKQHIPVQACSLPGAGATAPVTLPGVILLATAEILAILAMAQATRPETPVVACPIIFSTDMRTGMNLQASVESLKAASGAVQFIKQAFGLPTHNYGLGSDTPNIGIQSMSERSMLSMLMGLSGSDILGGAGQLEVATAVSPIQLILDNELLCMVRSISGGLNFDDENLAWEVILKTKPGDQFLTSDHTLQHCRDAHMPQNFMRFSRDNWENQRPKSIVERALETYHHIMGKDNESLASREVSAELDKIVTAADEKVTT